MPTCRVKLARHFARCSAQRAIQIQKKRREYATQVPKKGDKVIVALSAGVDSSMAAKLLADQDYDLSAFFMRNWDTRDEFGVDTGCEWEKDWEDVQRVCRHLDIPCKMIDLSKEYWNRVFQPALVQWELGVSPNPDVWCNKEIKFGALFHHLAATFEGTKPWLATGHYARKLWSTHPSPRPKLIRAADTSKDQSYYLSSISEDSLRHALFPIGDLTKVQVRELARQHNLPTAKRPESMGLCFVGQKSRFSEFLSSYIPSKPGPIVNLENNQHIGTHSGIWSFTVGQNVPIGGMPQRMFVAKKDAEKNIIYVVPGSTHQVLYSTSISVACFSWIWKNPPPPELSHPAGLRARVKHIYRMDSVSCTVKRSDVDDKSIVVHLDTPEKAVSLGQVVVLWDVGGEWVLGCGVITGTSD